VGVGTTTVWELTLENLILRLDTKLYFRLRHSQAALRHSSRSEPTWLLLTHSEALIRYITNEGFSSQRTLLY
jgi:hypothetical protein